MLQPHIQLDESVGCRYAILPGDPGRLDRIALQLENVEELAFNREFRSLKGTYKGTPVLAISTGIAGSSAAIALEETGALPLAGRQVSELSGGELQRVALARTLAQQSPVLLLDELAAGLDLARMLELFDLLERRRRAGAALLLVMHDCNLAAQYATRLLGLREGRVLFDGPVRRCFTAENLRALYAVDLHIVPHPRNGLPQALPLRPRGPEYREDSPHEV